VLETYGVAELVEARLETGRTHQIRAHFAHQGHPVVGDPEYGGRLLALRGFGGERRGLMRVLLESINRQALHAHRLAFRHPADGRRLEFESPLPADMEKLLQILRQSVQGGGNA
jgi:23S rRNA pseudouridine1911/1915/1917 synthase